MPRMGKLTILSILALALGSLAALTGCGGQSQAFPNKSIEFVVHTDPGDAVYIFADNASRILTSQKIVSQQMNVVTKSGGSSAAAYSYVNGKKGDPYFLLSSQPSAVTTPINQGLDITWKNFTPIASLMADENVVAVKADSPYKSIKDLVAKAKEAPKKVNVGGATFGAADSIVLHLLGKAGGCEFNYVAFKSAGESVVALLGGNVDAISCNPSEVVGQVQAGTTRVLAVASEKRSPFLPDVPTMKEEGLNFTFNSFRGVMAPGGITEDVVKFWDDAFAKLKDQQAWKDALKTNNNVEFYKNSKDFKTYLEEQEAFYRTTLDEMGLLKKK